VTRTHALLVVLGAVAFLSASALVVLASAHPGGAIDRWLDRHIDRAVTLPEPTKDPR
jgi:hypothetical protein